MDKEKLVTEGPSAHALLYPLQDLCLECGATEASGIAPDLRRLRYKVGGRVVDKLQVVLSLVPSVDMIFVHTAMLTRPIPNRAISKSTSLGRYETCRPGGDSITT